MSPAAQWSPTGSLTAGLERQRPPGRSVREERRREERFVPSGLRCRLLGRQLDGAGAALVATATAARTTAYFWLYNAAGTSFLHVCGSTRTPALAGPKRTVLSIVSSPSGVAQPRWFSLCEPQPIDGQCSLLVSGLRLHKRSLSRRQIDVRLEWQIKDASAGD
ncbi:hypothetical protein MRX96_002465 [Rhipicephalus microplus]